MRHHPIGQAALAAVLLLAFQAQSGPAAAEAASPPAQAAIPPPDPGAAAPDGDPVGFRAGSFLVVPIPVNDPTFGAGLVLGGGYLWQADAGSDTSFIGGGVAGTDEGSRAGGVGTSLSFGNGRYNLQLLFGVADAYYDLYILGEPVGIQQQGVAAQGAFRYGFTETVSAGMSFRYLESEIDGVNGRDPPALIDELVNNSLASVGLVVNWDTRDDTIYPTTGGLLAFESAYTEEIGGRGLQYTRTTLGYDRFWAPAGRTVIGLRAAGCTVADRAPFFDTCLLGSELRGFSLFEVYGDRMLAAQAELRQRLGGRLGVVLFAGAGEVERSRISRDSGVRYAGGAGLRFRVSQEFGLDMALDLAVNDDGDGFAYVAVGQAF